MRTRRLALAAAFLVAAGLPALALADGAFPDELEVFVPEGQPSEIILAANFGLI